MSSYPTQEEIVATSSPQAWLDDRFFRQDPYRFTGAATSFHTIACQIASDLDVGRNGVFCIGSSAIGLSLNPANVRRGTLSVMRQDSDIDMAVVSSYHFEMAWRDLLRATQPHLEERSREFEDALRHQRKRLFDGAILANKLLAEFSFAREWLPAMERASEATAKALGINARVEVWIYRDYWSLRNYVAEGLVKCQSLIRDAVDE